jgi:hypothetical protein
VYEGKLEPKSQVIQFTGADHSKKSLRWDKPVNAKTEKIVLMTSANGELVFDASELAPDPDGLTRIKALILELAKQHNGSLLVVSYIEFAKQLREWNMQHGILPEENIQHYRSLRGKNDFKELNATLLIGTPRIPKMDLLALAQVWYWQDPMPIDETAKEKVATYEGYADPIDAKGRGYVGGVARRRPLQARGDAN